MWVGNAKPLTYSNSPTNCNSSCSVSDKIISTLVITEIGRKGFKLSEAEILYEGDASEGGTRSIKLSPQLVNV